MGKKACEQHIVGMGEVTALLCVHAAISSLRSAEGQCVCVRGTHRDDKAWGGAMGGEALYLRR